MHANIMKRLFEHIVMTDHLLEHLVHVVVKYVYCCMCVYMYVCVCIRIQSQRPNVCGGECPTPPLLGVIATNCYTKCMRVLTILKPMIL